MKNPEAPAVKREAEEDWGKENGADGYLTGVDPSVTPAKSSKK
jgi:hypothetical protein